MRIETQMSPKYRPSWKTWQGLREIAQNAKDQDTLGFKMSALVTFDKAKGTYGVTLKNVGCALERSALLLGESSKEGNPAMIGRHGDGFKVGVLALLREDRKVVVKSGSEKWVPSFKTSSVFNAKVLVWDIESRKDDGVTSIEVTGLDYVDVAEMAENLLWLELDDGKLPPAHKLDKYKCNAKFETTAGTLLLDRHFAGKIYNRGIFVCDLEKSSASTRQISRYGYDVIDLPLDVDRGVPRSFDLGWAMGRIISEYSRTSSTQIGGLLDMLEAGSPEVELVDYHMSDDTKNQLLAEFRSRNGNEAVAVTSSESKLAEAAGLKPVVTTGTMLRVLQSTHGDIGKILAETAKKPQMIEFSDESHAILDEVKELLWAAMPTVSFHLFLVAHSGPQTVTKSDFEVPGKFDYVLNVKRNDSPFKMAADILTLVADLNGLKLVEELLKRLSPRPSSRFEYLDLTPTRIEEVALSQA